MVKPLMLGAASALILLVSNVAIAEHHADAKSAI